MTNIHERFWKKVRKGNECWEWAASLNNNGYGKIHISPNKWMLAHRLSWQIAHGPIPEKMLVLHSCDNPKCVNPEHLFIGSYSDNASDMIEKNRHSKIRAKGELHKKAIFREKDIIKIRRLGKEGKSQSEIAARFGCSKSAIKHILKRRCWKHI